MPLSRSLLALCLVSRDSTHPWSPADCVWLDSMAGYHFPAVFVRCKRGPATRTVVHCHANACDIGHIYELCQRDACLLYTSPSPRDKRQSRMPSSA